MLLVLIMPIGLKIVWLWCLGQFQWGQGLTENELIMYILFWFYCQELLFCNLIYVAHTILWTLEVFILSWYLFDCHNSDQHIFFIFYWLITIRVSKSNLCIYFGIKISILWFLWNALSLTEEYGFCGGYQWSLTPTNYMIYH